jgi:hypothetical protein
VCLRAGECVFALVYMQASVEVRTSACMHACLGVHVYVGVCMCLYVFVVVCVCDCLFCMLCAC